MNPTPIKKTEKLEFITGKNVALTYTIDFIIFEDSNFLIFIDKHGNEFNLNKRFISRRWQE